MPGQANPPVSPAPAPAPPETPPSPPTPKPPAPAPAPAEPPTPAEPPGPPSPPPSPPAPPPGKTVKRPVLIHGKLASAADCEVKELPNGKVLVTRKGKPADVVQHFKQGSKYKRKDVDDAFAALETTDERGHDAMARTGLRAVRPQIQP